MNAFQSISKSSGDNANILLPSISVLHSTVSRSANRTWIFASWENFPEDLLTYSRCYDWFEGIAVSAAEEIGDFILGADKEVDKLVLIFSPIESDYEIADELLVEVKSGLLQFRRGFLYAVEI